ncbi:hypothetical protein FB451DRAFT_1513612 [Mycena latifolia]|nr:hypothetical protein FB451DRAFT_1513612 [Mycena latifolia]
MTAVCVCESSSSWPMEAVALKLAGDVAVPAGTYAYNALKYQTGRAKYERGKTSLDDGFALLRDDKAGRLLSLRERVKLLNAHAELVANRKDVEEITKTFHGSLAYRNTAKEFKSKAKEFRNNVRATPAEQAQMEFELRKAKQEIAVESKTTSKKSEEDCRVGGLHQDLRNPTMPIAPGPLRWHKLLPQRALQQQTPQMVIFMICAKAAAGTRLRIQPTSDPPFL